jgi:hypothetical protein
MNVRRVVKWTVGVLLVVAVVGFLAFLYFIPPFTLMAPEEFSGPKLRRQTPSSSMRSRIRKHELLRSAENTSS